MASTAILLLIFFSTLMLVNDCMGAPTPPSNCKLMKPVLHEMVCTEELILEVINQSYANGDGCDYSDVQVVSPTLTTLNHLLQLLSDVENPQNRTLDIINSLNGILHSIPECLQLDIASGDDSDFAGIEGQEVCILDRMRSILKIFRTNLVFMGHTECPSSSNSRLTCNQPDEDILNPFTQLICSNLDYETNSDPFCVCNDCNFSSTVSLFEHLVQWIDLTQNSSYENLRLLSCTLNNSILPHLKNLVDNDCSGFELPEPRDVIVDVPTNLSSTEQSQGCLVQRLNVIFGRLYNDRLHFTHRVVDSPLATCNNNPPTTSTTEAQSQQQELYDRHSLGSRLISHFGRK